MNPSKERLARLKERLKESGIDLAAVGPTANMRYFLGFVPHADERLCLLLVSAQGARVVVPSLNREQVAAHVDIELIAWEDADGPQGALREALAGLPAPRLLAIDGATRADAVLQLQACVGPCRTITLDAVTALRECKSPEEIEALGRVAAQADRAMQAGVEACRVGATEKQVAWAIEAAFRQDGAEAVDFTLIASGPNGAFPHHRSSDRRLQPGDAIVIDIGATLDGFKSDITRMVHLGKPMPEFRRAYDAVRAANEHARQAVRPGVAAGDVDRVARGLLQAAGYGAYFTHRTGHGLGLEVHEPPWIMAGNATPLREGMVFSIEPGVYLPGEFGVRLEDIVVVTLSGARNLTGFDHSLVVKE